MFCSCIRSGLPHNVVHFLIIIMITFVYCKSVPSVRNIHMMTLLVGQIFMYVPLHEYCSLRNSNYVNIVA